MSDIVFEVIKLVVMLVALVAARYVIPYIKERIGADQMDTIAQWARYAVLKAQQVLWAETGEAKKEYVTEFLKELLKDKKITITEEQLDILIESAVKEMKMEESVGNALNETAT